MSPIIIIIIIILSSLSSSSSTSYINLPKILREDATHHYKTASSQFLSVDIDDINSETGLTVFVPDDKAFANASAYKTLPIENKFFVLTCHMVVGYLPPSLLRNFAKMWHLQASVGTGITGNKKYMVNMTITVNGSIEITNTFVRAIVTRTIYDHSPIAVYGISQVLLPKDLPEIHPPPPRTAHSAAAAICSRHKLFNWLGVYTTLHKSLKRAGTSIPWVPVIDDHIVDKSAVVAATIAARCDKFEPATSGHDVAVAELIDPALNGTLYVLKSCAKSPSVKRVILTSSVSAVAFNTRPKNPEVVVDETWFSDPDFCRESKVSTIFPKG
ncbi:hypothetical protein TSUD_397670 [Trifolium subterraneum]|uniref:FAS1 domain-containing protein n=1 Tax=Trifolium subterraneum TaxID=3900 RepID=A0A2Z6PBC3_TRISU|nr:hypothetical protein TSUD_397670 [Trifolium subterraneum]